MVFPGLIRWLALGPLAENAIMKILMILISFDFPPDLRVEKEARALVTAGHQVTVVCENRKARVPRECWHGVDIIRLPPQPVWWRQLNTAALFITLRNPLWERHIQQIVGRERPDAIHVHDLPFVGPGLRIARKFGLPLVADLHENYPAYLKARRPTTQNYLEWLSFDPGRFTRYERPVVPQCDRIIVVVDEAAERVAQLGVERERIFVVGNAEDIEYIPAGEASIALPEGAMRIGYVGGVQELRGLQTAVAAMPEILSHIPDALLVIVGDGLYRPVLAEQARTLGVEEHIRLEGHQPFEKVHRYIEASDVCIVPHLADELVNTTIPHKLFQYMYMGKPVIVSSARPLRRIVEGSNAGLVFASGDPASFASAVLQLHDPLLRKQLGENGRRAVIERYNWQVESKVLVDLYRQL
jgi:glycosyltransferase involved in cell wall biosynthesis